MCQAVSTRVPAGASRVPARERSSERLCVLLHLYDPCVISLLVFIFIVVSGPGRFRLCRADNSGQCQTSVKRLKKACKYSDEKTQDLDPADKLHPF